VAWFEYGETQNLGTSIDNQLLGSSPDNVSVNTQLSGLKYATTYYYRFVATNSFGRSNGTTVSFATAGGAPKVTTKDATSITAHGAVLNADVNPSGLPTYAWFEYGTSPSFGNIIDNVDRGSGMSSMSINTTPALSGLLLNTRYWYRIVANNSDGTSYGDLVSSTTEPAAHRQRRSRPVGVHVRAVWGIWVS
jgi:phosphodiesterase/alkaline phosphatase D-like protein